MELRATARRRHLVDFITAVFAAGFAFGSFAASLRAPAVEAKKFKGRGGRGGKGQGPGAQARTTQGPKES